jgi:hypothetical protein
VLEITKTNLGKVVGAMIYLRERKEAMQARHKAELKSGNDAMAEIEDAMRKYLVSNDLQSVKAKGRGTAYIKRRSSASVQDAEVFLKFVTDNDLSPLMEVRASAKNIEDYIADEDEMPPGIKLTRHQQVIFTRGK